MQMKAFFSASLGGVRRAGHLGGFACADCRGPGPGAEPGGPARRGRYRPPVRKPRRGAAGRLATIFQKQAVPGQHRAGGAAEFGAYTFNGGGFYTNQEADRGLHRLFPASNNRLADYLISAPYLELGAVALVGVRSHNDQVNLLLIIAKSEAIMLASAYAVKLISHE